MPLTSPVILKTHCGLQTDAAEKVFNYADQAKTSLLALLGKEKYDQVEAAGEGTDFDNLSRAESYLCMYHALPFLNLRPTKLGGLSKIIGYGDTPTEMLMSEREMSAYRAKIYSAAIALLGGLREQVPEDPDAFNEADIDSYDAGPFTIG